MPLETFRTSGKLPGAGRGALHPPVPPAGGKTTTAVQGAEPCIPRPARRRKNGQVLAPGEADFSRQNKNSAAPQGATEFLVGEGGFEPPKAKPADLQSVKIPFISTAF